MFRDAFAEDMLGPEGAPVMMGLPIVPGYRTMRFLMAARSRHADDALVAAISRTSTFRSCGNAIWVGPWPPTVISARTSCALGGRPEPARHAVSALAISAPFRHIAGLNTSIGMKAWRSR